MNFGLMMNNDLKFDIVKIISAGQGGMRVKSYTGDKYFIRGYGKSVAVAEHPDFDKAQKYWKEGKTDKLQELFNSFKEEVKEWMDFQQLIGNPVPELKTLKGCE